MTNWDIWIIDASPATPPGRIVARRLMDVATMSTWDFVIEGARLKRGDPDGPDHEPAFDRFTINGNEPTQEEQDEFSDEIRDIVWDTFTDT